MRDPLRNERRPRQVLRLHQIVMQFGTQVRTDEPAHRLHPNRSDASVSQRREECRTVLKFPNPKNRFLSEIHAILY